MVASAYDFVTYENDRPFRARTLQELNNELWGSRVATETPVSEPVSKTVTSRIRVLLSRPLTWAEKEDIETDWTDPHQRRIKGVDNGLGVKISVAPNFEHVWLEGYVGSRILFEIAAALLEQEYVNVFPKAVRTFREYNGE
jgi:hypothetical protein